MTSIKRGQRRWPRDRVLGTLGALALAIPLAFAVLFIASLLSSINITVLELARPALGTFTSVGIAAMLAIPLGIAAGVLLEEYAPFGPRWLQRVDLLIATLGGVPPAVYGVLAFAVLIQTGILRSGVIAAAFALALVMLPMMVLVARQALHAVPSSVREAAYATGATRYRVVRHVVLPNALPGVLTGAILAIAQATGVAAPLIVLGVPGSDSLTTELFGALEMSSQARASSCAVLLMLVVLAMNSLALYMRLRRSESRT